MSQFKHVGAIYAFAGGHHYRWHILGAVVLSLLASASKYGMFHELLIWGALVGNLLLIVSKQGLRAKLLLLVGCVLLVSVVQVIKVEYRKRSDKSVFSLLTTTIAKVDERDAFGETWLQSVVVRMNQGWIVSAAMYAVPNSIAYGNGQTIKEAVVASLVPRFLNKNKAFASGTSNVNRFTMLNVRRGTSMGLGPLGECYVNFGVVGGSVAMFIYGVLLSHVYQLLGYWSYRHDFFFYCIPIVFLQLIKMETEFLTVFNHLTKSLILVFGVYYFWVRKSPLFYSDVCFSAEEQVRRSCE